MKNYTITVNGNVYDVTVEEKGAGTASVAAAAPVAAPKAAPAAAPKAAAPAGAGSIQVKAGVFRQTRQKKFQQLEKYSVLTQA